MISSTGEKAQWLLRRLRMDIFTPSLMGNVIAEKAIYLMDGNTYIDMRNTSTAKVDELINRIANVPNRTTANMKWCVLESSVNIQSFLFDRFLYADQYLERVGSKEIFLEENTMDFLRQCLLDFWEDRERSGAWA
jgi:hypothetical protein